MKGACCWGRGRGAEATELSQCFPPTHASGEGEERRLGDGLDGRRLLLRAVEDVRPLADLVPVAVALLSVCMKIVPCARAVRRSIKRFWALAARFLPSADKAQSAPTGMAGDGRSCHTTRHILPHDTTQQTHTHLPRHNTTYVHAHAPTCSA